MFSSTVELVNEVAKALQAFPEGCDLLISCFAAAIANYRRASVCTPFPPFDSFKTSSGDKNFELCRTVLQHLQPIPQLRNEESLAKLPLEMLQVLQWLTTNQQRPRRLRSVTPATFTTAVYGTVTPTSWPGPGSNPSLLPHTILALDAPERWQPFKQSIYAFHGTSMENMHSILQNGLLNLSNTLLQRNGAIFGDGIYMSTDYQVAFSFCRPGDAWQHSLLGPRLRCMLVCEVNADKAVVGDHVLFAADGSTANGGRNLPPTYLVVRSPECVRLAYVLVYRDSGGVGRLAGRVNWCTVVIVLYVLLMLAMGASRHWRWR